MFWSFFLGLFVASIIVPIVFSLLSMPALGLMGLLFSLQESIEGKKKRKAFSIVSYPIMWLIFLAEMYILSGWSAYVSSRALVYSSSPRVTHKWVYYVVGFFLCHGPLGYMAAKEGPDAGLGTKLGIIIAMLAYILFSIWPTLMSWPYGWLLRWIY